MHSQGPFKALHMNVEESHIQGNGKLGRYILLPGSDGRAREMAKRLLDVKVLEHSRQHNFYMGHTVVHGKKIDIGIMSSGMGCPSMDIIATELLKLGAKRIIRVGTAGSLQPKRLRVGRMVIPSASVRDDGTSRHYLDPSIPVLTSLEFLDAARLVAREQKLEQKIAIGIVHTKDSLYAREFGEGPLQAQHKVYMEHLMAAGVLASEMECAQLFTLIQIWNKTSLDQNPSGPGVRGGAILAIVGDDEPFANNEQIVNETITGTIDFGFACIASWAKGEDSQWI
ncbi:MAG: uridine phosphorylase [Proteobacteria bacterium]|nr:MAG: uridine phosphorylase [Pseudomonadota bacterium]